MAKPNKLKDFKIIRLRHLSRVSGIEYAKIRNNIRGTYDSFEDQDRTRLFNALQAEVEKATLALGFTYDGKQLVQTIPGPKSKKKG